MRPYANNCPCIDQWLSGFLWGRGQKTNAYTVTIDTRGLSDEMLVKLRDRLESEEFEVTSVQADSSGSAPILRIVHPEIRSWTMPQIRYRTIDDNIPSQFLIGLLEAIHAPNPNGILIAGWNWAEVLPSVLRRLDYDFIEGSGRLIITAVPSESVATLLPKALPQPVRIEHVANEFNEPAQSANSQLNLDIDRIPAGTIRHLARKGRVNRMLSKEDYSSLLTFGSSIYSHKWPIEELRRNAQQIIQRLIDKGILDLPCGGVNPCRRCRRLKEELTGEHVASSHTVTESPAETNEPHPVAEKISKTAETRASQARDPPPRDCIMDNTTGATIWHLGAKARKYHILNREQCESITQYGREVHTGIGNRANRESVEMLIRIAISKGLLDFPCTADESNNPCERCQKLRALVGSRVSDKWERPS